MGSWASCWLGPYQLSASNGDVDPHVMRLFQREDKRVVATASAGLPAGLRAEWQDLIDGELDGEPHPPFVYYEADPSTVRDRLSFFGYTTENASAAFRLGLPQAVARQERLLQIDGFPDDVRTRASRLTERLRTLTVEDWQRAAVAILRERPTRQERRQLDLGDPLLEHMIGDDDLGFPGVDRLAALRLIADVMPEDEPLIYDISQLVWSDYFSEDDDVLGDTLVEQETEVAYASRVIVLTEGASDSWILRSALSVLYPHMSRYYSFMDFEAARPSGGAGQLANLVKAFVAAGVANRVIALFDNDTAAAAAIRGLRDITLPERFKIVRLPDIDLLREYPTLGPTGPAFADVNGLAASIEMFLGRDVLFDDTADGDCLPIQWTGYDSGISRYQGEVLQKRLIHERFREKVKRQEVEPPHASQPWNELRLLFRCLFSAFHDVDGRLISTWAQSESE
jgi:hypothetical protein